MSNSIQVRRGSDAERLKVIFSAGEPVWTTDTGLLYIGDGITPGGIAATATNLSYSRNSFSQRFNQQVSVSNIPQALDFIFNFTTNVANTYFYGDISSNASISNDVQFIQQLTGATMPQSQKEIDVTYISNSTYRAFAYPMSFGALADIQDPSFNYSSVPNTYEPTPRQVTYQGTVFFVYITTQQNLSLSGKTMRYLLS